MFDVNNTNIKNAIRYTSSYNIFFKNDVVVIVVVVVNRIYVLHTHTHTYFFLLPSYLLIKKKENVERSTI